METKFAWRPVMLYELVNGMWCFTGTRAWLEWVRVVRTEFGDVIHTSLRKPTNDN